MNLLLSLRLFCLHHVIINYFFCVHVFCLFCFECVLLIELTYRVFAHIHGVSYEGQFSSLLCLCGIFQVLINLLSFFISFFSPFLKFCLCMMNKRFAIIITCVDFVQIQFCDTVSPCDCCFSTK